MLYISFIRMRDMKNNTKPQIKEAFRVASQDMLPELKKLRKETFTHPCESWVVGVSELDSVEVRRLNRELGLTTNEGFNQWYKI